MVAIHRSHEQAGRWYDGFVRAIGSLSENPQRCPLARENASVPMEIRELRYGLGRDLRIAPFLRFVLTRLWCTPCVITLRRT